MKALHYYAKRFFAPLMLSCEEQGQMYYEQDKEIVRTGESWMYERTAKEECLQLRMAMESTNWRTTMSTAAISAIIKCLMAIPGRNWPACQCR